MRCAAVPLTSVRLLFFLSLLLISFPHVYFVYFILDAFFTLEVKQKTRPICSAALLLCRLKKKLKTKQKKRKNIKGGVVGDSNEI